MFLFVEIISFFQSLSQNFSFFFRGKPAPTSCLKIMMIFFIFFFIAIIIRFWFLISHLFVVIFTSTSVFATSSAFFSFIVWWSWWKLHGMIWGTLNPLDFNIVLIWKLYLIKEWVLATKIYGDVKWKLIFYIISFLFIALKFFLVLFFH